MKIHPVGAELFHVGRQTDMTKLTVAFRNFANASKNRNYGLHFFFFLTHFQLKNRDRVPETFQSRKGFHGRKSLKISAVANPAS